MLVRACHTGTPWESATHVCDYGAVKLESPRQYPLPESELAQDAFCNDLWRYRCAISVLRRNPSGGVVTLVSGGEDIGPISERNRNFSPGIEFNRIEAELCPHNVSESTSMILLLPVVDGWRERP